MIVLPLRSINSHRLKLLIAEYLGDPSRLQPCASTNSASASTNSASIRRGKDAAAAASGQVWTWHCRWSAAPD
jgi:hypothetical protein